jgi:hypothetical protein
MREVRKRGRMRDISEIEEKNERVQGKGQMRFRGTRRILKEEYNEKYE